MPGTKKLRVGTDCSGIEAPIQALKNLKVPFQHVWACERDKFARMSIEANYKPERMYEDIESRDHSRLPDVDLYVCGFPCQPFSALGKQDGMKIKNGKVMLHCIEVIRVKQPMVFILENVSNFKTIHGGKPFRFLIKSLDKLGIYNVYIDTYDTMDYGIPQQRRRVYIVGVLKTRQMNLFIPPTRKPMQALEDFFLDKSMHHKTFTQRGKEGLKAKTGLDFDKLPKDAIVNRNRFYSVTYGHTATCTTHNAFYIVKHKRYATAKEYLLLQGFPNTFKCVVSDTQLMKQAGNAMSVNVVQAILASVITSLNMVKKASK
jgi:DNA (cytosine-5)-methyltransferase 1